MPEELLTIRQAALLLSVSETSLRRWTNSGVLASLRVGGRRERRFRREDLEAFMEHLPAGEGDAPARDGNGGQQHVQVGATPVQLGAHLCGFYGSDAGRLRLAANFLTEGVTPHCAGFLVAAEKTRASVLARLREKIGTVDKHLAAGRLVLDKPAETPAAQLKFWEKRMLQAMRDGARTLRVVADISAFPHATKQKLEDYEGAYETQIAQRFPVVTLCLYDARETSGLFVLNALKAHPGQARYLAYHLLA